jgi:uncharacterized protein
LQNTAEGGHLEVVKMLFDFGADVNTVAGNGERITLQAAAGYDYFEIVKILFNVAADINIAAENAGRTALQAVAEKMLVDAGADVNTAVAKYEVQTAL